MSDCALVFARKGAPSSVLVFGDSVALLATEVSITGTLPSVSATIRLASPVLAALVAVLPGPVLAMSAAYLTNTQRPTVARLLAFSQVAGPLEQGVAQPEQHAQTTSTGTQGMFRGASPIAVGSTTGFANAVRTVGDIAGLFQDGAPSRDAAARMLMQEGDRQWLRFFSQFQEADRLAAARLTGRFEDGLHDRRANLIARYQTARQREALRYQGRAGAAQPTPRTWRGRVQQAWPPPAGISTRPAPPVVLPACWGTTLVFQCPPLELPYLLFGATPCNLPAMPFGVAGLYILPARFYMSTHSIYAQRLPDLTDVPIFAASVSADSGSYCWSLQASGPASLFELLAPAGGLPAQLRLTLDGIPWVFAIDSISRSAQFGQTGVNIQGRSVTALIAAPYLRATTRNNVGLDRTAQQLAVDALAGTGIALDWGTGTGAFANGGLVDWLVSANAWSHQGTPLDAVQSIAQAAGGYLQSHRSSPTILSRHPYGWRAGDLSGAPWDWEIGPADIELAPDAIITEAIVRQDGPDINAVYVSGTSAGVLALVKRQGSAADKLSGMVTDALITHSDAARQRGLSVLGAAGHKYAVRLDLPVLTGTNQPGVLDVGQLVQVNAPSPWRGRVRSVAVSAKQPSLRQTVTLERHIA